MILNPLKYRNKSGILRYFSPLYIVLFHLIFENKRIALLSPLKQNESSSPEGCVEFGPDITSSDKSLKVMLNSQDKVSRFLLSCSCSLCGR